jgi:hypothetical protein
MFGNFRGISDSTHSETYRIAPDDSQNHQAAHTSVRGFFVCGMNLPNSVPKAVSALDTLNVIGGIEYMTPHLETDL